MERLAPSLLNLLMAAVCLGIGVIVLARSPHRANHRAFALFAGNLMVWALTVFWIVQCQTLERARAAVLVCEIVACFIPATFYHFACYFPKGAFDGSRIIFWVLYAAAVGLALTTPSSAYIRAIEVFEFAPPKVTFGPLYLGFISAIVLAFGATVQNLARKRFAADGLERRQIQYVIFATGFMGVVTFFMLGLTVLLSPQLVQAYGPVNIIVFMSFVGYAMVRYHLLDTRGLLARTAVLSAMVIFVLASVTAITYALQRTIVGDADFFDFFPSIVAAVVVIILFQAIRARIEEFVEGTMLKQRYDVNRLYARVAEQAAEDLQLDRLLKTVCEDIRDTVGVRAVRVMLLDDVRSSTLVSAFSTIDNDPVHKTSRLDELLRYLRKQRRPVLLEQIIQHQPDEEETVVAHLMAELDTHLCLPLYTSSGLVGVMLLGQKDSHDIYSEEEYTAFRALAGPLGTAIANARLYQEVDSLNLHLSNLFRQMREGVIAVDTAGRVTTTNEASRKILGPIRNGQSIDELPAEVRDLLRTTLAGREGIRDYETNVRGQGLESVPVIMSSSCLKSADGATTGAVALIYDILQVKRLEQNVMRADRLSSVGTLAAGMAHEIKNPLVSIKTFTQLLVNRYDDQDFRETFSDVIPHEVDRIDSIVSRLLDFARPRPVKFAPQNVRRIAEGVLALVENQARNGAVRVETNFPGEDLFVYGDDQQLHQVFLNLVLNAIDSMSENDAGVLKIGALQTHRFLRRKGVPNAADTTCALITVTDTGCGISQRDLEKVFTPFFTTKDEGCGLGLAVVHGIVTEHGGDIHVSSKESYGTTVSIALPLAERPARAEAIDSLPITQATSSEL